MGHQDICNVYDKRFFKENDVVKAEEAADWLKRCVIGGISKEDLDEQRRKEINGLDML